MKKIICGILACLASMLCVYAQPLCKYRISFTDKMGTAYSLDRPEEFLSSKALERRIWQQLPVDETDLPVSNAYLDALREKGMRIAAVSKWNNTAVAECADSSVVAEVSAFPFVSAVRKVWTAPDSVRIRNKKRKKEITDRWEKVEDYYGRAHRQISVHQGDSLHAAGFRGEGMTIAVIDGGYYNADAMKALENVRILGVRDFVNPASDIYAENNHGMKVLSCMAVNQPYVMVGTAPGAAYWLLRSEDTDTEQLVEEDYWVAAVEFADSAGVDVINTSLGYKSFDNKQDDYEYRNLDGKYSIMSYTAGKIADKGMVLVCSAGNEGQKPWKKITPPADARNVLTVGATNRSLINASFSSVGNTADGRVKPDVMAVGQDATVLGTDGTVSRANGTSFASPILCGLVACLWQACSGLTAKELISLIRQSGDRADFPDNIYGYGVPDMWSVYKKVHNY